MLRRKADSKPAVVEADFDHNSNALASPRKKDKPRSEAVDGLILSIVAIVIVGALVWAEFQGASHHNDLMAGTPAAPDKAVGATKVVASRELPVGDPSAVEYHVIFSTGCSVYQDWQSYFFFYQAMAAGQPGNITRIVSGCSDEDETLLQDVFDDQIKPMAPDRFHIHFTPDYSKIKPPKSFVYFNKPFGTKHWLEKKMGFPDHPINPDAIVILMDPDQAFLRPFTGNDFSNTAWKFLGDKEEPRVGIQHGQPMGQMYGFGLQWKDKVNMSYVSPDEPSPIDSMSRGDAQRGYILGPPYIATAADMYKIALKWCDFAVPVHDLYPYLLAEMFAYCLSAAHQLLSHQTAASFMVSDVGSSRGEGWSYVDKISDEEICEQRDPKDYPNVIHFCQRYGLNKFFFGKRRLPKDFLTCEHPLLLEPPKDIAVSNTKAIMPDGQVKDLSKQDVKRNAFMLCHLIRIANEAATYFKERHCEGKTANFEKSFAFHENMSYHVDEQ